MNKTIPSQDFITSPSQPEPQRLRISYVLNKAEQKLKRITFRVPQSLKRAAVAKSDRTSETITHICTQALVRWLNRPDPEQQ